jgi:hypothetical protein
MHYRVKIRTHIRRSCSSWPWWSLRRINSRHECHSLFTSGSYVTSYNENGMMIKSKQFQKAVSEGTFGKLWSPAKFQQIRVLAQKESISVTTGETAFKLPALLLLSYFFYWFMIETETQQLLFSPFRANQSTKIESSQLHIWARSRTTPSITSYHTSLPWRLSLATKLATQSSIVTLPRI